MYNELVADHAAAWALSKVGCGYSQSKRTEANYFDCSSLVARAYSAQGKRWLYGGNVPLSNQEVYDDDFELVWPESYSQIGKIMGGREVISLARNPGDLQFLCTDSSTTRANRIADIGTRGRIGLPSTIMELRSSSTGFGMYVGGLGHIDTGIGRMSRVAGDALTRGDITNVERRISQRGCSHGGQHCYYQQQTKELFHVFHVFSSLLHIAS